MYHIYGKIWQFSLYNEDFKERIIMDHGELQFNTNDGWNLIRIPKETDGLMSDHEFLPFTMIYLI